MISDRIDLTLDRDFGANPFVLDDILRSLQEVGVFMEEHDLIFMDEHEYSRKLSIFGPRGHYDQRIKIFGYPDPRNPEKCDRCGKTLRAPWNKSELRDLCEDCYLDLRDHGHRDIYPWKIRLPQIDSREILYTR